MHKILSIACLAIVGLLSTHVVHCQDKVVVIPMSGDDVALAQQHFRYTDFSNFSNNLANYSCASEVFSTPNQATQVVLVANANAKFSADDNFWQLNIQYKEGQSSWQNISSTTAYSAGFSDAWSQISTTDVLDLNPNSSYQFRLSLKPSGSSFSSGATEYCQLLISVSFKLPAGKNILEILP